MCVGLRNLLTITESDNKRLFKNLLNFENTALLTRMYRLSYCLVFGARMVPVRAYCYVLSGTVGRLSLLHRKRSAQLHVFWTCG